MPHLYRVVALCAVLTGCTTSEAGSNNSAPYDMATGADMSGASDMGPDASSVADVEVAIDMTTTQDMPPTIDMDDAFAPVELQSAVAEVQPMTGIVLWEDSWNDDAAKDVVQLEYAYIRPSDIVTGENAYDWAGFESFLDRIAGREHQAVVRFYYTYPGEETAVPDYIKALGDYSETSGTTEGQQTWFPDWSNAELQRAHLAFYGEFAGRYDDDPRIAFLQVGFGLWGEYHIYDGPNQIGQQFPSKSFQTQFFEHLDTELDTLKWSISIDAGDDYYSPLANDAALLGLNFGNFDDSFMHEEHDQYNESMWNFFGHQERYKFAPHGGELSYYTQFDQQNALNVDGIHGRTYEDLSAKFHITYMIGNDQPHYQSAARIKEASIANGYRFRVTAFESSSTHSRLTVQNDGIAPIYYDAFLAIDGTRSTESLKGLAPGESLTTTVAAPATAGAVTIESDRLVPGQTIQFDASL